MYDSQPLTGMGRRWFLRQLHPGSRTHICICAEETTASMWREPAQANVMWLMTPRGDPKGLWEPIESQQCFFSLWTEDCTADTGWMEKTPECPFQMWSLYFFFFFFFNPNTQEQCQTRPSVKMDLSDSEEKQGPSLREVGQTLREEKHLVWRSYFLPRGLYCTPRLLIQ